MKQKKLFNVIGVMTGTSMDGIDISYVSTDGIKKIRIYNEKSYQYSIKEIQNIKKFLLIKKYPKDIIRNQDTKITKLIVKYLSKFLKEFKVKKFDYISLSGQTIFHNPDKKISIQLGNAKFVSKTFKTRVISNFRENDIKNGGQGAPIGAFYHKLLLDKINKKAVLINLGGVANFALTYQRKFISSDIGPANALSDDLMMFFFKKNYDKNGILASKGKINLNILNLFKKDKFFKQTIPKSLDRNNFHYLIKKLKRIKSHNALCTSIYFTIFSIMNLLEKDICSGINEIIFTGGGRKNKFLISQLKYLNQKYKISIIDNYGFDGDLLEAQMFAYIGVRSLKNLSLSSPYTTRVKKNVTGGNVY